MVFLVVADHDARVFGASLVPIEGFHISAVILGADVQARKDARLVSQVDLAPTLLSYMGLVRCIYGPSPFCKTPLTDVRINHCSHISGLLMEAFYFLAPMVICAHPPHHPSGFFTANARTRF